ncbi:unnamed protein product [Sympodiomycopsis kandeliae]
MASTSESEDARSAFNIKVLKRHDPQIATIVHSASFVVLYQYDNSTSSWSKTGIEGPMFLYKRTISPHYGMFVLNRNGVENFSVPLTKEDELQLTDQFVILRTEEETSLEENDEGETIIGVWVFEKDQRQQVGEMMQSLQDKAAQEDHIAPPPTSASTQSISLDALFSSQQQPQPQQRQQQPALPRPELQQQPQSTSSGPALLDAIFQSAASGSTPQPSPSPVPAPIPNHDSATTAATGLMAMLGLGNNTPTNGHAHPPPQPEPTPIPVQPQPEAKSFRDTAVDILDAQVSSTLQQQEPPMNKGEFMREILSLIHTDKSFSQELYNRYLASRG